MKNETLDTNLKKTSPLKRQTNLETVNEMYKTAFLIKKERFTFENPELSDKEIFDLTLSYFRGLSEKDKC